MDRDRGAAQAPPSSRCKSVRAPLALLVAATLCLGAARAQIPSELVEQALDQRIASLEIGPTPLPEALQALEQRTGLRFRVAPGWLERLPDGANTRVQISVRDSSVRSSLRCVFGGMGLRMQVRGDVVELTPIPAVGALTGRLAMADAELLSRLACEPWNKANIKLNMQIDEPNAEARFQQAVDRAAGENALAQLDAASESLGWAWLPQGGRVTVLTRPADIARRLNAPIDIVYERKPLDEVLVDLGTQAGVLVQFEPGALAGAQFRDRTIQLRQQGVSIRQTLERISGLTGLRYELTDEGVLIRAPAADGGAAAWAANASAPGGDGTERWLPLIIEPRPGLKIRAYVPVDQLPEPLRAAAIAQIEQQLRALQPPEAQRP